MRRHALRSAAVIAALVVGACGGGSNAATHAHGPAVRPGVCGEALARIMERAFISPSSSVAERLRARRTLDLIAAHRASIEPVCASRTSVQPTVSAR
jgi:hypothetical protein